MKVNSFFNKKIFFWGVTIILFILVAFLAPIYRGVNLLSIVSQKRDYYALSEERQELFDKMKIEYVNIKSRVTGTAPFNDGEISDENGVDVTDKDDYVRTLDVMKYTVELGISPNTDHSGVTSSSVYEGGVIKVRAKLPNQGTPTLMRWEEDAWMQNVKYSNDKTEIYAEYHVPSGVSVTNANQNLTFTVKVDGYKKEVTSEMAPEFEVWMEGNKPDDATSLASSLNAKDNRNIIISGKYSFDYTIRSGLLNIYGVKDGVEGQYVSYAILAKLYQPYSNISDLRGVLYPKGKINIQLSGEYKYFYSTEDGGWTKITDPNNLLNNTQLIAFNANNVKKDGFYPSNMYYLVNSVGGKRGSTHNSVYDSGIVDSSINNNILNVSFENYKFDGIYPTCVMSSSSPIFGSREGVFGSANIEVFVPYYNPLNRSSVDNQINLKITKVRIDEDNYSNGENESYSDGLANNSVTTNLIKRNGSIYSPIRSRIKTSTGTYLSKNYYSEDAASVIGDEFIIEPWTRADDGPYDGGMDNLISWNSNYFELKKYTLTSGKGPESMYDIYTNNVFGFDIIPEDNLTVSYGIYKNNREEGLISNELANGALYNDFDWYPTFAEASTKGTVTAIYVNDPDNIGLGNRRFVRLKFQTKNKRENIGTVGMFRMRTKVYGDTERTQVYYFGGESAYNSSNAFRPSLYDENGNILTVGAPEELGESIMILGVKSNISINTTDTDSSGKIKSAYDVQEGEINLKMIPTLSDGSNAKDSDLYYDDVIIKATLPNGLSYKNGSANKAPKSVTVNADGSTTIEWEYDNWQVNHNAPEYPNITFTADISASLENNASLKIKSTIFTEEDLRDEKQFRTSEYGVVISNLAGSKALKEIDKPVVEKNESFVVTSTLGNNSEEVLRNVRTIEILPTNNDEKGSKFSGNYTTKITEIIDGQKLYYTNKNISEIGLTEDKYGKLTIKDVDLENDSRWIEVNVGDIIPNDATAIATMIPQIPSHSEVTFNMEITPSNNKESDKYGFNLNMTSDNLQAAIKTNTVVTTVVSRKISGKAFIDENRDGIYDSNDTLLKRNVIRLLDGNDNVVSTTQTDENGKYIFEDIAKGNYYVEFSIPDNYETITKGQVSKVNSNGKTDLIETLNVVPTEALIEVKDVDIGIQKIPAKIFVRYEEYGNSQNLFDSKDFDKYYGDTYNLDDDYTPTIPDNYEFKEKSSNYAGTVNKKEIYITYYYQKKDSKLTSSIAKSGTDKITNKTDFVSYKITYKTKIEDYLGQATIKIVDTLPYEIDENHSNIAGGVYDSSTKTITWTINKNIASINEPEIVIEKDLKLKYLNIDSRSREMVNIVDGVVTLDSKERSVENQFLTKVEIPGKITVKYIEVDKNNEEIKQLVDPIETTNLIGERYTSEEKSFEGYVLVEKPNTEEYFYEEEEQEVVYKYEKIQVKVETIAHGIGGKIVGDEVVYYGENSTKDKIVIEAEEGYQIERIVINGEEIKINGIQTKMILDNFKEMKEDKLVEVSFKKIEKIKNPATGNRIFLTIFILFCIMLYTFKWSKTRAINNK